MSKVITGFHAIEEQVLSVKDNSSKSAKDKNSSPKFEIFYSKPGPRIKKILFIYDKIINRANR